MAQYDPRPGESTPLLHCTKIDFSESLCRIDSFGKKEGQCLDRTPLIEFEKTYFPTFVLRCSIPLKPRGNRVLDFGQ